MSNLTTVTLTTGVPTAGNGTVSTLDNLIGTAGTGSAQVLTVQGNASGTAIPVSLASVPSHAVTNAGTFAVQSTPVTSAVLMGKVGIDQTTDGTTNKVAANIRHSDGTIITDATGIKLSTSQLSPLSTTAQTMSAGFQVVGLPTDQPWPKGLSNKAFSAAFSTLTRAANATAYSAGDSISDNATPASVTALSATISDTNNDPIFVSEILISSTDTGLAGKRVRAYLYNSDPTASTGVVGGDNLAFSNKKAGYIGSFSGVLESGFSDGTVGRLVPTFADGAAAGTPHAMAGGYVVTIPTSGAKTLFIQYQAVDGFTPSGSSTTIIGTARGWQGRAA